MSWQIARYMRNYYCWGGTELGLESVQVQVWAEGHVCVVWFTWVWWGLCGAMGGVTITRLKLISKCHEGTMGCNHYSISFVSCFLLCLHSCVSHSYTHCLAVFPLTFPLSPTNALLSDSIYKTPSMYVCDMFKSQHLTIVLIVYSTSSSLWTPKLWFPYFWNTLALFSLICSPLFGYAQVLINFQTSGHCYWNTWTHDSR